MLDIKFVRENVDVVKENMRRKNREDLGIVELIGEGSSTQFQPIQWQSLRSVY